MILDGDGQHLPEEIERFSPPPPQAS